MPARPGRRAIPAGAAGLTLGLGAILADPANTWLRIPAALVAVLSILLLLLGLSRLLHDRTGGARLRERLVAEVPWTGREVAVDLGGPDGAVAALVRPLLTTGRVEARAAGRLDLPDGVADAVLAVGVLGPLSVPLRRVAMGEAARVLAPGGRLIVADSVPGKEIAEVLAGGGLIVEPAASVTRAALTPMWVIRARRPG